MPIFLRKIIKHPRVLIVFALFVLTLIPLGRYSTVNGYHTSQVSAVFAALPITVFAIFMLLRIFSLRQYFQIIADRLAHILYAIPETQFRIFIFCVPLVFSVLLGYLERDQLPRIIDSIVQYSHARLLLDGKFSVPGHPMPEFFWLNHTIIGERWYSMYSLGHLLFLAAGHFLHAAWLVSPLLCAGSALLTYLITRDHYSPHAARIAGMLAAFCPFWWLMASDYMSHNSALFCVLLFAWAWLRSYKNQSLYYPLIAGIGLGLAVITRPLTAFPIALPFIAHGFWRLRHTPVTKCAGFFISGIISFGFLLWQLYFNRQTTGDWLMFGHTAKYGDAMNLGFGYTIDTHFALGYYGQTHSLAKGIGNMFNNLVGLNGFLFNWPAPSLLFVFLGVLAFRAGWLLRIIFTSWALLCFAYIFFFYQDWCQGPRYLYEITGFLIIATAVGITRIPATCRALGWHASRTTLISNARIFLLLLCLGAIPLLIIEYPQSLASCQGSRNWSPAKIDKQIPDNSLVFVERSITPFAIYFPPLDSNRVIYARNRGKHNQKLMDYYPGRSVFILRRNGSISKVRDPIAP